MTTSVIITSPKPNHHRVGVQIQALDHAGNPIGELGPCIELDDGQSHVAWVHDHNRLVITEIKKDSTP